MVSKQLNVKSGDAGPSADGAQYTAHDVGPIDRGILDALGQACVRGMQYAIPVVTGHVVTLCMIRTSALWRTAVRAELAAAGAAAFPKTAQDLEAIMHKAHVSVLSHRYDSTGPQLRVEAVRDAGGSARISCGIDFACAKAAFAGPLASRLPTPSANSTAPASFSFSMKAPTAQVLVAAPIVHVNEHPRGATRQVIKSNDAGDPVEIITTPL